MDSAKQQIVEKLQAANNILLTVSSSPSVDQLAACIGLTLLLNKLDKHATAVFSGQVPSTIDFLKPEATLEKNTDSLRDFIIALDKSKADKLRYKVEDKVVKIFITPYRTSLTSDDLEFSQGDFNVDVVLALGVKQQADLDEAITAHGRILHDATVVSINNTKNDDELGSLNWQDTDASSLSELATQLAMSFDKPDLLDGQIATALLTGIVAETDRFRNEKTTASTMSISADLMKAGANQQLVAKELEHEVDIRSQAQNKPDEPARKPAEEPVKAADDGTLEIAHRENAADEPEQPPEEPVELPRPVEEPAPEISDIKAPEPDNQDLDAEGGAAATALSDGQKDGHRSLITEPPLMGGTLTANTVPEGGELASVGMPTSEPREPLIAHENRIEDDETPEPAAAPPPPVNPAPQHEAVPAPTMPPQAKEPEAPPLPEPSPPPVPTPPPVPKTQPPQPSTPPPPMMPPKPETLTELEEAVHSPHAAAATAATPATDVDAVQKARDEVLRALNEQPADNLPPVQALNAQPLDLGKPEAAPTPPGVPVPPLPPNAPEQAPFSESPADKPLDMPLPPATGMSPPPMPAPPANPAPGSPPSVPPPFMPGNFGK